jgi:hypothetical protein
LGCSSFDGVLDNFEGDSLNPMSMTPFRALSLVYYGKIEESSEAEVLSASEASSSFGLPFLADLF